jgi:hypothetical protein
MCVAMKEDKHNHFPAPTSTGCYTRSNGDSFATLGAFTRS